MLSDNPGLTKKATERAHLGDTYIQNSITNGVGLTINSKVAARTDYTGQYSHGALLPVKNFVPRPQLPQQLVALLHDSSEQEEETRRLVVVCGIGGAGKSQVVLNYIRECRRDYAAVFWIEAGQKETIERDFLQIYHLLYDVQASGEHGRVDVEDAVRAVKSWFSGRERRWLMVLDSADTIDNDKDASYIDIEHFLPDDASAHVIITTRSTSARGMPELEPVEVAELETEEATELLLKYTNVKTVTAVVAADATLITEELGHLALAITLAGSYIAMHPWLRSDIRLYLPGYRRRRRELLSPKPKKPDPPVRGERPNDLGDDLPSFE